MKSAKKTVYFDGECPMCQAFQTTVASSKQSARFTFVDVNTESLPVGITKAGALQEMHVVDEGGVVYKNAESVLAVLDEYKYFRWVAVVGRLPILKTILRIGYRLVAKNRYVLFGPAALRWWLKLILIIVVIGLSCWVLWSMFIRESVVL